MTRVKYCSLLMASLVLLTMAGPFSRTAQAEPIKDLTLFFFGNSLNHHLTDTEQTTMPYWLDLLARADTRSLKVAGQWGTLRNFAADLPPEPNWNFKGVTNAMQGRGSFASTGFDSIVITPANFIQYKPATETYDGDNPKGETPISAMLTLVDWIADQTPNTPMWIFQGWPDMGGIAPNFPPNQSKFAKYNQIALTSDFDWYEEFEITLLAERPNLNINLLPVAPIFSDLLTKTALSALTPEDLFTDNAPHGTPTAYFLSSLISYPFLYGAPPPNTVTLPETVHPLVVQNYQAILDFLDTTELASVGMVLSDQDALETAITAPNASNTSPSLAMGLDGVADWSAQHPFVNIMKSSRSWIGHLPDQWGGVTTDDMQAAGLLDDNGWLMAMPKGVSHVEAILMTNRPEGAVSTAGRYRLTYKGTGTVELSGRANAIRYDDKEIWFDYTPGEDVLGLFVKSTDPDKTGDYIRDIAVVHETNIPLYELGILFNPIWTNHIQDLRMVRFMDWMYTNGSEVVTWEDRPKPGDATYTRKGVPVEVLVALANQLNVDPWFNMPHMADDTYVQKFASYVYNTLNPQLETYAEYSNELWNFTFPQTEWAMNQSREKWGETGDGWLQLAGVRAAEMSRIWKGVYGDDAPARLKFVIATHTGWPGLEEALLQAPQWRAEDPANRTPPVDDFDAYAVTGYFGFELGMDPVAETVVQWLAESKAAAETLADNENLTGWRRTEFIGKNKFYLAVPKAIEVIANGSVTALTTETFPYHAGVAQENGLEFIMYEGGSHVVGIEHWANNDELAEFFVHLNYTNEMAQLYASLLESWKQTGGTIFNAFVDVARTSKWGSWGALRHLDDTNPRWQTLVDFNSQSPDWWSDRNPKDFENGVQTIGTAKGDTLTGTPKNDIFIGKDGDDIFLSLGGGDHIHGGPGNDTAVLLGAAADYQLEWDGSVLVATNYTGTNRILDVERLQFSEEPGKTYKISNS